MQIALIDPNVESAEVLGQYIFQLTGNQPQIFSEGNAISSLNGINMAFVSVDLPDLPVEYVVQALSGQGTAVYLLVETTDPKLISAAVASGGKGVIPRVGAERQIQAIIRRASLNTNSSVAPEQNKGGRSLRRELDRNSPATLESSKPLSPGILLKDNNQVVKQVLPRIDKSPSATANPVLVFYSNKGGVGKTTLSVATSIGLTRLKKSVCLVDLDIYKGNVAFMLGITPKWTILDWVQNFMSDPGVYLSDHDSGLKVLSAPLQPLDGCYVTIETVERALKILSRRFDYVVVDSCPIPEDVTLLPIECATYNFLIGDPNRISFASLRTIATNFVSNGIDISNFSLIINRMPKVSPLNLSDYLVHLPSPLSNRDRCIIMPEDPNLQKVINNFHLPVGNRLCKPFNRGLSQILKRILPSEFIPEKERKSFLSFFKKRASL